VVSQHVVMLTWPPDGRYSPLSAAHHHQQQQQQQADDQAQEAADERNSLLPVRALVLPLNLHGEDSTKQITGITLEWSCLGSDADLASGFPSRGKTLGTVRMQPVGQPADSRNTLNAQQEQRDVHNTIYAVEEPQMFAAAVPLNRQELGRSCGSSCGSSSSSAAAAVLLLQVVVTDDAGGVSSSELRPVLLPHAAGLAATGVRSNGNAPGSKQNVQHPAAATAEAPSAPDSAGTTGSSSAVVGHLPLPSGTAERLLLTFDGPAFAVRLFFAGWLAQVLGLLLLPR
jgi:hypothetical protein